MIRHLVVAVALIGLLVLRVRSLKFSLRTSSWMATLESDYSYEKL
jgi:hypothetical protein